MTTFVHNPGDGGAAQPHGGISGPPVSPAPVGAHADLPQAPVAPSGVSRRPLSEEEIRTLPMQALLVRNGALTIEHLSDALRENVSTGRTVEDIAVERGWVSAEEVSRLLAAKRALASHAEPESEQQHMPLAPPPTLTPAPNDEPARNVGMLDPDGQVDLDTSVGVFLNLTNGERLWAGRYQSEEEAMLRAQEIVRSLMRPEPGAWPEFGGRFIRPEAVISVELSPRLED